MREITVKSGEDLRRIEDRLGALRGALNAIGSYLESQASRAFVDQKLGDFQWPERYPSQEDPFVNVAGIVSDFSRDIKNPPKRRFERRPAAQDTGVLSSSFASEKSILSVTESSVEVGTTVPYAAVHQWGGDSTQPITETTRSNLLDWLMTAKGKKAFLSGVPGAKVEYRKGRDQYALKLLPLLSSSELKTQVNQRPFLGITKEAEEDIPQIIEAFVAGDDL